MAQEKTGWLVKEGGSIKTWKKRYFVLKNAEFTYFKGKGEEQLGSVSLNIASGIRISDRKRKPNCFEIITPHRVYAFSCEQEEERNSWIESLQKHQKGLTVQVEKDVEKVSVEDFDLLNLIGKGSFGKVLQVKKKDNGKIFAMKVLDKKHILDHNEVEHTLAEKHILQRIHHPFLVNLHYSFQTEDKLYFVLDYVNGGELFFHLQKEKRFSEERVRFYAAEILLALEHLHVNGIIYRDLKPENILITSDGHICLTDFGLCKTGIESEQDRTTTFCGTPEYLAPEILEGNGYGKSADWWSYGTLLYEMLNGLPPFYDEDVQEMYTKILSAELEIPEFISDEAADLLVKLLERDPSKRLQHPPQIKGHPFFAKIDWKLLLEKKFPPPWVPEVKGEDYTGNIDESFLLEPVTINDEGESSGDLQQTADGEFEGFTYKGVAVK